MRALELLSALRLRGDVNADAFVSAKARLLGPVERVADPRPVGPSRRGRTIAIAFEGLHGPSGDPIDGALGWLEEAVERFDVAVMTSMSRLPGGALVPQTWLKAHGLPSHVLARIRFPADKPPSNVYLDPRALRFEGCFPDVAALLGYAFPSQ